MTVLKRSEVVPAVEAARRHDGPVLINFKVEQEDTVYPDGGGGRGIARHDPAAEPDRRDGGRRMNLLRHLDTEKPMIQ